MTDRSEKTLARPASVGMRALALGVAALISLALTLDPYLLSHVPATRMHEGASLLMLGVSGAFVFGFGFAPANRLARAALHPAAIFAAIGAGLWLLAFE
jgi:hypothetical protein